MKEVNVLQSSTDLGSKDKMEKIYNRYVRLIEKEMRKRGTTYADDLEYMGFKLFGRKFKGVFARDKIPHIKKLKNGDKLIFNLDKEGLPGSHWCAMVINDDKKYVYDSFGRKVLGDHVKYTELDKEQKIREKNCGQRCLAWLLVVKHYGIKNALKV